jgi:hypothetical protein
MFGFLPGYRDWLQLHLWLQLAALQKHIAHHSFDGLLTATNKAVKTFTTGKGCQVWRAEPF